MADIEVIEIGNVGGPKGDTGPAGPPGAPGAPGSAGPPTGSAGGSLTGTYPNPTLAANSVGASQITDGTVGNTELANMPSNSIKGNISGAAGPPQDLSAAFATSMLDVVTSASKGLAPASGGGTTNFLRADGTWSSPPGGGGGGAVNVDTIWDAKGDLAVATGADAAVSLPVGTNGTVLTADSSLPTGIKWATPTGGGTGVVPYTFTPTKTANYTASANEYVPVNATSGAINITLPAAPANGTRIAVDVVANTTGNNVTVFSAGADIIGNPAGTIAFRVLTTAAQKWRATYNSGCWYEDVRNGFASAGNIPITPTATLISTNVQTALQELDGDIQAMPTLTSSNTGKVPVTTTLGVTKIDVDKLQDSSTLTTKGDLYVATASNVVARVGVGSDGQVLTADAAQTPGVRWATPTGGGGGGAVATDVIFDAKGDLPVGTGADTASKLTAGANGFALITDSSTATGLKWAPSRVFVVTSTDGYSSVDNTQIADVGFSMPLLASATYVVEVAIFFTADPGADIKSSIRSSTTGWTFTFSCLGHSIASTAAAPLFYCQGFDQTNFTWTFGSIAAPPAIQSWQGKGVVITGANAGNLEFWYSENAPLASPATIRKAKSYMTATRLA